MAGTRLAAHRHREREVDREDRRRAPRRLELLDLEVIGVQLDRRARTLTQDGVANRLREIQRERFAGLPRFRGLLAVAPARDARHPVHAERRRVAQLREEVAQGLLADLAHALGRQVQLTALTIDETLVLQALQRLLEAHHVASGVVAEVSPNGFDVHFRQTLGRAGPTEELLEALQLAQLLGHRRGVGEARPVVAAHPVRATPVDVGRRHAQVRHQSIQREVQLHVLHHPGEHRAQFALLVGGQGVEHRLGRGGALGHHAHHVLEVLGAGEEVAELLHEVLERGIEVLAASVLLDHGRERVHHVAHPRQFLGVGSTHHLLALLEVRIEDVAFEFGHELFELLAGLARDELVVLVLAQAFADPVAHQVTLHLLLIDQVARDLLVDVHRPKLSASARSSSSSMSSVASMSFSQSR